MLYFKEIECENPLFKLVKTNNNITFLNYKCLLKPTLFEYKTIGKKVFFFVTEERKIWHSILKMLIIECFVQWMKKRKSFKRLVWKTITTDETTV